MTETRELTELTRPELDTYAREHGVENPESLPNKQAVIDAIGGDVPAEDERAVIARQRRLEGKPILTSGTAGAAVEELCRLLAGAGYETSVSKGENAYSVYDPSVQAAVEQFRSDHDVEEDPSSFGAGDQGRRLAAAHVGPETWTALLDAQE